MRYMSKVSNRVGRCAIGAIGDAKEFERTHDVVEYHLRAPSECRYPELHISGPSTLGVCLDVATNILERFREDTDLWCVWERVTSQSD